MICAYDEILLNKAETTLGKMLDYAVHSLHLRLDATLDLFISSGVAALYEHGDIRTVTGSSGVELAFKVLDRSGVPYERAVQRHTSRLSPEYRCGHLLARLQHMSSMSFYEIIGVLPPEFITSSYASRHKEVLASLPWDADDEMRSGAIAELGSSFTKDMTDEFLARLAGRAPGGSLRHMRIANGLSQSMLAEASGVPLRSLQQYEQGQKNIKKANAEYIFMLASALHCNVEDIL